MLSGQAALTAAQLRCCPQSADTASPDHCRQVVCAVGARTRRTDSGSQNRVPKETKTEVMRWI